MAPPNTIQQDIHDMIYHDIILQHITCMTWRDIDMTSQLWPTLFGFIWWQLIAAEAADSHERGRWVQSKERLWAGGFEQAVALQDLLNMFLKKMDEHNILVLDMWSFSLYWAMSSCNETGGGESFELSGVPDGSRRGYQQRIYLYTNSAGFPVCKLRDY